MTTESRAKEREMGVLEGRLLCQSEEVERLRKALHEAEQRKPALPEQPSAAAAAATVQQQLLHTMETSELRVELATAEEGRQEVERQLGALQRQVQLLEEEVKQGSQKVYSHFRLCTRFTLLYMCVGREVVQCKVHWPWSEGSHRQ